jgi:hypothetical protein
MQNSFAILSQMLIHARASGAAHNAYVFLVDAISPTA